MGDAVISVVVERIAAMMEEQIRYEVNLVRGVEKEVISLSDELKTLGNVLEDAERRRFKEESVKAWLKKLEDMAYEMDDVLDQWNYAIVKDKIERHQTKQKVHSWIPSSPCLCFKSVAMRRDVAIKIQSVKERLDLVLKEKDRYNFVMSQPSTEHSLPKSWRQSTSSIELGKVQGRGRDRDHIVSKLSEDSFILAIVGVGGLGKTTLAQLVFNDSRVEKSFDLKFWICVSDPFDLTAIVKGIIESAKEGDSPNTNNLEILLQCVREIILRKKFLLVLDDVWTEEYAKWEPLECNLKYGAQGSKILVTTRNERVAKVMGAMDSNIYRPQQLSDEECWSLMRSISFSGRNDVECGKLEDVGKEIAIRCKGLPLAGKTLGSLLRFKNSLEEWENVLQSEIWQLEEAEVDMFPHLLLSYNELSPALKRCFSYCAIFPKDDIIVAETLVSKWMALSYLGSNKDTMELKGWEYIKILAARCLVQDIDVRLNIDEGIYSFKMHDIVHDFASFVRNGGSNRTVDADESAKKKSCHFCSPSSIYNAKAYRSLLYSYKEQGPSDFCNCLTGVRVLDLEFAKLNNFPRGMEKLIHLRWLELSNHPCSAEDVKTICQLYNLKDLSLSNCCLEEIPREIGNLIHLKHLDLCYNLGVKELPESICGLLELESIDISYLCHLCSLPEGFDKHINLKHLYFEGSGIEKFPRGLAQLTSLLTLKGEFCVGSGWNKMGWLKSLNHLCGSLLLDITLHDDDSTDVMV